MRRRVSESLVKESVATHLRTFAAVRAEEGIPTIDLLKVRAVHAVRGCGTGMRYRDAARARRGEHPDDRPAEGAVHVMHAVHAVGGCGTGVRYERAEEGIPTIDLLKVCSGTCGMGMRYERAEGNSIYLLKVRAGNEQPSGGYGKECRPRGVCTPRPPPPANSQAHYTTRRLSKLTCHLRKWSMF